jgi:uncharacterized protein YjdB
MLKRIITIALCIVIFMSSCVFPTTAIYSPVGQFSIGVIFPPSYANTTTANYQTIKDMNASYVVLDGNGIGNYDGNDLAIQKAAETGLKVVVSDDRFKSMTKDSNDDALIEEFANRYKSNPTVIGYNVFDEPRAKMFSKLANVTDKYRTIAPDKMTYTSLLPGWYHDLGYEGVYGHVTETAPIAMQLTSSTTFGQSFTTNSVTTFISAIQLYIDSATFSSNETMTLKLWNSPARTVLIAQTGLTGGTTNSYPQFNINAVVGANSSYFWELTHNGSGDNSASVYMGPSEVDLERGGAGYVDGVLQPNDFWFTINQNIQANTYNDYVYRWAKSRPDFLMNDHYPWPSVGAGGGITSTYYSELETMRTQSLAAGIPFWSYIQSFEQPGTSPGCLRQPTQSELFYQVFTNIAYGCKGINYFLYWSPDPASNMLNGLIKTDGTKNTALYNAAQSVNSQLNYLGPTLNNLKSKEVYHTGSAIPSGTVQLPSNYNFKPTTTVPAVIGVFENIGDKKYIMVVNRDYTNSRTITFNLSNKPSYVNELSKTTGAEISTNYSSSTGNFSSSFAAGEGRLYVVSNPVSSISMKTPPSKNVYSPGQALDLTGAVITSSYEDGTTCDIPVALAMVSGYNSNLSGYQKITVTHQSKTAYFDVTVKKTSIENFDSSTCISGVLFGQGNINVTFNSNSAYTKNSSFGSLKVFVPRGNEVTWPNIKLINPGETTPRVFNISSADKVSYWLYNNTANATDVVFNDGVIINVPANSWKYSEFIKGTADFNNAFPDTYNAKFKFDIWNYNYHEYNGSNTVLYEREIYIDEINVQTKQLDTNKMIESFDGRSCMNEVSFGQGNISATFNTNPSYKRSASYGSLRVNVPMGTEANWPNLKLVNPGETAQRVFDISSGSKVSFWLYNNSANATDVVFNNNVVINVPANSWKYSEYTVGTSDYNALFPNPVYAIFKFDIWNYNFYEYNGSNTVLYAREIYIDEIFVDNTKVGVTGITLDKSALSIGRQVSSQLTETVTPANATNKTVVWTSNNPSVATVSATGLVTGIGVGTATITASTADGGLMANCVITVTRFDSTKYYKITYDSNSSLVMDATNTGNNGVVKNVTYSGASSQQWQIIETTDANTFKIVNRATGYALKVNSTLNATNSQIIQTTYTNANNMNFTISESSTYIQIVSKLGSSTYIKCTGATEGTLITANTSTNTRWDIALIPWTYQGVVNGITDGEVYDLAKGALSITFSEGTSTLNGNSFLSGGIINQTGNYQLILVDEVSNLLEIDFTIIDTSAPKVYGVSEGVVYNSRQAVTIITFNKGTATLNGNGFISGASIDETGDFTLVVTDVSNNTSSTVNFSYIKYGDVTGDGIIDTLDLVNLKSHLLNINQLSGVFSEAGDINGTGKISVSSLLAVKKHILGLSLII